MSALLWFGLAVIYLVVLLTLGVTTLRKGHYVLFVVGIFFPILWLIGAVIGPSQRAASAQ